MMKKRITNGVALLNDEQIRRVVVDQRTLFAAVDILKALADSDLPAELWSDLKQREPVLASHATTADFAGSAEDALDLEGVFRLIQSVPSDRAERLRQWLAKNARERLEEAENPELAILRTQKEYQQHGYDRDWISKRLQSIGGRRELASEWYRRGARESDEFRALTNELISASFGMDVNTYRRYKGLWRSGQNLRDHMTDLELALVSLGETVAANLHRQRRSNGFEALNADAKDAGTIVAGTRAEIERQTGHSVVSALNHVAYKPRRSANRPNPPQQQVESRKDVAA
jgi:DNA-damage-inducible protein D